MDVEDLEPRAARPQPKNLDDMSIDDLEAYIAELEAEIARVRTEIAAKRNFRNTAESFFRK